MLFDLLWDADTLLRIRRPRHLRYGIICVASGKVVVWCWRNVFGFHFLAVAASLDSSWLLQKARIQDAGDCKLYCLAKQATLQWLFQVSTYPASSLSLSDPTARSAAESIGRAQAAGYSEKGLSMATPGQFGDSFVTLRGTDKKRVLALHAHNSTD